MGTEEVRAHVDAAYALELMRAFLQREVERQGEAATARQLHVPRGTLRAFMDGDLPGSKLWEAATDLALNRPLPDLTPEAVAVALLADQHPPSMRPEIRARIRAALRPVLEAGCDGSPSQRRTGRGKRG
jgi:hypothetical protein